MRICSSNRVYFLILPIKLHDPSKIQEILSESPKDGFGLQIFDADLVAGYEHIILAVELAVKAWKENRNLARTIAMESLLYASTKRQIKDAILTMGPSPTSRGCIILALSESKEKLESTVADLRKYGTEDESLIELTQDKIQKIVRAFGIGEPELSISRNLHASETNAVQSLVLERVSLSELTR